MTQVSERALQGGECRLHAAVWDNPSARHVVVLAHGYGEHIGRYGHVAEALVGRGAAVYGLDHAGHGRSEGERCSIRDFGVLVDDVHRVVRMAQDEHPGLPIVLVGHSMGGLIATLYAQKYGSELAGLVLSGPAVGDIGAEALLGLDELPEIPIDPSVLSRDDAVGHAYAEDPLVYHGGFKRETLQGFLDGHRAAANGPGFGDLPTLWIHGGDDALVPIDITRPVIEKLAGSDFTETIYPGARHEVFNETNRDEVIGDVGEFVARVTAARG